MRRGTILLPYGWFEISRAYWFLLGQGIPVVIVNTTEGLAVHLHYWVN